jgi:hypothetical protein
MSEKRSWYVLDTAGSKPYRAVGPHVNYSQADRFGFWEFGTYSLVKISRRMAQSKYRVQSIEQFKNAS